MLSILPVLGAASPPKYTEQTGSGARLHCQLGKDDSCACDGWVSSAGSAARLLIWKPFPNHLESVLNEAHSLAMLPQVIGALILSPDMNLPWQVPISLAAELNLIKYHEFFHENCG